MKFAYENLFIVALSISFCVSYFTDLSVAREVLGFFFLSFVPGYLLANLIKMDFDRTELILFSIGFSLVFLMVGGLLYNELGIVLQIKPFSVVPFDLFVIALVSCFSFLTLFLKRTTIDLGIVKYLSGIRKYPAVLFVLVLPVLSAISAIWANFTGNTSFLLLTILILSLSFAVVIFTKKIPRKYYPVFILSVAFALLIHTSLTSDFLQGHDIHLESYVAQSTLNNGVWSALTINDLDFGRLNAMLSVTILPTIYSNALGLNIISVLLFVFPLFFIFVPLALYKMWSGFFSERIALISVILFMSEISFYSEMLALTRQMVAELFFVLLLYLVLKDKLKNRNGKICFIIFSFALIVSHYAIAILFLFFALAAFTYLYWKKKASLLPFPLIMIFTCIMFLWYLYISNASSFTAIVQFGDYITSGLSDFFVISSRDSAVLAGLGISATQSALQMLSRVFAYSVEVMIFIGFILAIVLRKYKQQKAVFAVFSTVGMLLIAICVLLPNFADTLRMERFFHLSLFVIAPLFVVGTIFIARLVSKKKSKYLAPVLIAIILIPYFLFQTGFVYEAAQTQSWSVPLSKYRMSNVDLYQGGHINPFDVQSTQWVSRYVDVNKLLLYADAPSKSFVLVSYGMFYRGNIQDLTNVTHFQADSIIYLNQMNVLDGIGITKTYTWNMSQINLQDQSTIYTNGYSEAVKIA
ncbi:MAG: DUF2206 domain-containing protein [Candidatus Bathyarchaeia archaeon]|jgi:uncharacterized membrane protein